MENLSNNNIDKYIKNLNLIETKEFVNIIINSYKIELTSSPFKIRYIGA